MAAAQQAFGTAEFLGTILLNLPQKDILRFQSVGQEWRNVIKGSGKLQRVLYLSPLGPSVDSPRAESYRNPLIEEIVMRLNSSNEASSTSQIAWDNERNDDPILWYDASWKRMFLTQLPIKHLRIHGKRNKERDTRLGLKGYLRLVWMDLEKDSGITMDDFFQTCEAMLVECRHIDFDDTLGDLGDTSSYATFLKRVGETE